MAKFLIYLVVTIAGAIGGLLLGYASGIAVYEIAIVPSAAGMEQMERDSYLCSAGGGIMWLGILAGFVGGAIFSPLALAWKSAAITQVDTK